MTRPVPTHPAQVPFTSNDRLSTEAKIYLQKLEEALKEAQEKIAALEAYHP